MLHNCICCSEACEIAASRIVRALLWAVRRAEDGVVILCLGMTRRNRNAKSPVWNHSLGSSFRMIPQLMNVGVLDARRPAPGRYTYEHDLSWALSGIHMVQPLAVHGM